MDALFGSRRIIILFKVFPLGIHGNPVLPTSSRGKRRPSVSPAVWSKLVEGLDSKAHSVLETVLEAKRLVERVLEDAGGEVLGLGDNIESYAVTPSTILGFDRGGLVSTPVAGVDSSMTKPVRLGHRYYVAVSAAAIIYPEGYGSEPFEEVKAYPRDAPDKAEPQDARKELSLEMFRAEIEALGLAANRLKGRKPVVFLDGPIVDPPRFTAQDGLLEKYTSYAKTRARLVKKILAEGGLVVGVVKRVTGALFVEELAKEGGLYEKLLANGIGDYGFALYASRILRERLRGVAGNPVVVFRVFELPLEGTDYALYRGEGLRVYSFLAVPALQGSRGETRPIRVEVATTGDPGPVEAARLAAAYIRLWLLPGTNIPEPVALAHERCSIRRREAVTMLREITARSLYHAAHRMGSEAAEWVLDFMLY